MPFKKTLNKADRSLLPKDEDPKVYISKAGYSGEVMFDVTDRTFNNISPTVAVNIADALYEAAGKAKRDEPSVTTAESAPAERSLGELVEEADKRFSAARQVVAVSSTMPANLRPESDKTLDEVFAGLLGAVMMSSRKREILKALLG